MYRLLSVAVLGIASLTLTPQASQAQTPVAAQVQVGPVGVTYGYPAVPPTYVVPPPAPVYVAPPVYAGPSVVVAPRYVYYPWRWDGHRWIRHEHWHYHC
jgi:hypothetical protein